MTGGIHIAPGTNATINGIEVQKCVDLAIEYAKRGTAWRLPCVPLEVVAAKAAKRMTKARAKGYSRDICRDILWATVIDEAQRLKL